jgi:hypothetical protein
MGALNRLNLPVDEKTIIQNILFMNDFVHLSDRKVFIRQMEDGNYFRISFTTINNTLLSFIKILGHSSFDLNQTPEHKKLSAKMASQLMEKYNEISN